jgi:hypothetical protein
MTTSPVESRSRSRIVSLTLVGLATLVAAGAPLVYAVAADWPTGPLAFAASYSLLLAVAGVLAMRRSTGAQLIARSMWWSTFGGGALICLFAGGVGFVAISLVMVLATGTALLASGRIGLSAADAGGFAPAAYRTSILVSMIMALADAQALGWVGAVELYEALDRHALSATDLAAALGVLSCSGVALIALYGLYKLQLWGLVLSALTTVAIGLGALVFLSDAGPIPYAFALSAAIQIALLVPLFVAIARRRAPRPPSPRAARLAAIAPALVILALAALSVMTVATGQPLLRF